MLKHRILTALFLIPLVLVLLFYGNLFCMTVVMFLLVLLCGWEWARLIPLKRTFTPELYLLVLSLGFYLCSIWYMPWLIFGLCLWVFNFVMVLSYPNSQSIWGRSWVVSAWGLVLLPLFAHGLLHIYDQPQGKGLLLYVICLVWAGDTGAYFSGKSFGKHKLIPRVSPGKTWEGLIGALLFVGMVAGAAYYALQESAPLSWSIIAFITLIIAVFGDLFISMLKRRCHVKDTGTLLPGHGGVLDRLDSLIAALPWFHALLLYFYPMGAG